MDTKEFYDEMRRIERKRMLSDRMYHLFDIAFWTAGIAVVTILSGFFPLEKIFYQAAAFISEKFLF